jgi:hypothetical protein
LENHEAGESVEDIAYNFDLKPNDVPSLRDSYINQIPTRHSRARALDCIVLRDCRGRITSRGPSN